MFIFYPNLFIFSLYHISEVFHRREKNNVTHKFIYTKNEKIMGTKTKTGSPKTRKALFNATSGFSPLHFKAQGKVHWTFYLRWVNKLVFCKYLRSKRTTPSTLANKYRLHHVNLHLDKCVYHVDGKGLIHLLQFVRPAFVPKTSFQLVESRPFDIEPPPFCGRKRIASC